MRRIQKQYVYIIKQRGSKAEHPFWGKSKTQVLKYLKSSTRTDIRNGRLTFKRIGYNCPITGKFVKCR